jgi:hypothetical protein
MKQRKRAMTFERWLTKYKPIKNPLCDAPYGGLMFETFGEEKEEVRKEGRNPFTVWTLLDNDVIIPGWHFVNRLGYFVTEVPFTQEEEDAGLSIKA